MVKYLVGSLKDMSQHFSFFSYTQIHDMGTIMESPDNLQFNTDDIIFISLIFAEKFKFYGNTSNFTILGKIIFFTLRLRISSPKLAC